MRKGGEREERERGRVGRGGDRRRECVNMTLFRSLITHGAAGRGEQSGLSCSQMRWSTHTHATVHARTHTS